MAAPSALTDSTLNTGLITEGNYVILCKKGGEHIRSIKLLRKQNIIVEKLKVNTDGLIGQSFGLFEITNANASPVSFTKLLEDSTVDLDAQTESSDPVPQIAPSSNIATGDEAQSRQKYTEEEIDEMKRSGASTSQLVAKLVEGNQTFQNRTEYSKSKYIRKKTRKHSDRLFVLRPTVRLLCESYFKKDPERISNLRWDQLGLILQLAGIHSGKRVVIFEQSCGILTSSVIERLGGRGSIVLLHRGLQAQGLPCVQAMNFATQVAATLHPLRIDTFLHGGVPKEDRDSDFIPEPSGEKMEDNESLPKINTEKHAERSAQQRLSYNQLSNGYDSLLIAARTVDPISILELLYDNLRPCGTVVIYNPVIQSMVHAQAWLRSKGAVNVQIQEQMFRTHQVLPQRTHPLMSQMVVGGCIVSGIKVVGPPPLPPQPSSTV